MYVQKTRQPTLNYTIQSAQIAQLFTKNVRKTEDERLMIADYILVEERDSPKKLKFVFISNARIYVSKDGSVTRRFGLLRVTNVVIAGLSGEVALLMEEKQDIILDSLQYKTRIINLLQNNCKKDIQYLYVNNTSLQLYLRKDNKTKTIVKPIGKYLVDLRKVEENLSPLERVEGMEKYVINGLIAESQVCKIYYVHNNVTNIPFAVKAVRKEKYLREPKLLKKAITSVQFHQKVKSKFICRLVQAFHSKHRTYMVMEYLSSYTLAKVLTKKGKIKEEFIKIFLAEVSAALSIIHDAGYVYNNLRLTHVMLDLEGHIKLIDFNEVLKIGTVKQQINKSVEYASPEELNNEPLTAQSDWWQLGILSYELMFGYNPFLDNSQEKMKENIKTRQPDVDDSSGYSEKATSFIKSLLKKKPEERLGNKNGFYQILKHQFFDGLKPSVVINRKLENPYSTKNNRKNVKLNESFCEDNPKLEQLEEELEKFVYDTRFED